MAYFDYHSHIKKLIRSGALTGYYFDKRYKNIGFSLVLCFGQKKYPVREDRFAEYFSQIGELYQTQKYGDFFVTKFI